MTPPYFTVLTAQQVHSKLDGKIVWKPTKLIKTQLAPNSLVYSLATALVTPCETCVVTSMPGMQEP